MSYLLTVLNRISAVLPVLLLLMLGLILMTGGNFQFHYEISITFMSKNVKPQLIACNMHKL